MAAKAHRLTWSSFAGVCLAGQLSFGAQAPSETIIRDGVIVNASGRTRADVLVRDGVIAEIGQDLVGSPDAREIDADGLLVLPGGVDPHVHIGRADDYQSASEAALAGGITTISNFAFPRNEETLADALARESALVDEQAIADVILHAGLNRPDDQAAEIASLPDLGHTSVKVFMNRPVFDANARTYLGALASAGDAGVLTMIHCEDDAILAYAAEELMRFGRDSLRFFPESRPVLGEVIATGRAVAMAEITGSPIYIVHLSSEAALRVTEDAQARGLPVAVETRPIYLHFTRERFENPDRGLYVGQPPLREKSDQDALWKGIANGTVHVVGTDHVAYKKEEKLDPSQTVASHRAGMNNLQVMRPMLFSEGVGAGRITVEELVAVTAENPAKLFGLHPRKGVIAVGSDADLVLWAPEDERVIRDEDMLSGTGFSIYAGWEVTGWPRLTMRRGEIVYEGGRITAKPGSGQLLRRERSPSPR